MAQLYKAWGWGDVSLMSDLMIFVGLALVVGGLYLMAPPLALVALGLALFVGGIVRGMNE